MQPTTSYVSITDQFCGAGGSSLGAQAAGCDVVLAMNHWSLAIETHNTNFPETTHVLADISQVDPRRYPTTDILITSPECTNHSLAKGQKRKNLAQLPLFEDYHIDPAAERSRATMWDVPRFAEFHNYNLIIVENVVDARYWRLFDAWLHAMRLLDYEHEIVYFNSMFAHPTPQSRDRMYIVFWKRGNTAPDLTFAPPAYCEQCGEDVAAVQSWKKDFPWGRYRKQYVYRCPQCLAEVTPYYYAAANAIDWSDPGQLIGDRKRPLKAKTLERVQYGLDKFGTMPAFTQVDYSHSDSPRTRPVTEVLPTQSTRQVFALSVPQPFLLGYYTRENPAVSTLDEALPTQSAQPRHYLVNPMPFFIKYYSGAMHTKPVTEALGAVTTQDHHAVVTPPFIVELRNKAKARELTEPLATVTAGGGHHGLVMPFLASYYGTMNATPVTDPAGTITTVDRHSLVTPGAKLRVEDCHFRMLKPEEIGRAMAFPDDYAVLGNKRDRVRQYGNAVTPPVMSMLIDRCVATLAG